jgi:hypothetical protein
VAKDSRELGSGPAVDPHEEPSAEWGWHGSFPRAKIAAGVVSILVLLVFAIGPYQSRTQDLWLIGIALLIAFAIVRNIRAKRNAWRR